MLLPDVFFLIQQIEHIRPYHRWSRNTSHANMCEHIRNKAIEGARLV